MPNNVHPPIHSNTPLKLYAAPLQEYTMAPFRNAHAAAIGGVDEYYTPFVRLEQGKLSRRSQTDIAPDRNRAPVVPQILVKTADETERLLQMVAELGYTRVDFNFGCPFPKVTQHGYGAGMLPQPDAVKDVLHAAAPFEGRMRFSAKMRLGMFSPHELNDLLPILNDFPFEKVVLHPRTAVQQYGGQPDRVAYQEFAERCRCPVCYNGDICTLSQTDGLERVMIGRALLANPLLPLQWRGQSVSKQLLLSFHRAFVHECEAVYVQPLLSLKVFWTYFLPNVDRRHRKAIQKAKTLQEYAELSERILSADDDGTVMS